MESCHGTFICTSQSTDTGFLVGVRRLADGAPTENPHCKIKENLVHWGDLYECNQKFRYST